MKVVHLPDDIHLRVKMQATHRGRKLGEFLAVIVDDALSKLEREPQQKRKSNGK